MLNSYVATSNTLSVFQKSAFSYVLRGAPKTIANINTIEVGDVDGDAKPDIFIGDNSATIRVLDGLSLKQKAAYTLPGTVYDILYDHQALSAPSLIVSIRDKLGINKLIKVDAKSGKVIWSVDKLIGIPQKNSVHLVDTNNDGKNEITIGTDKVMYITR